MPVLDVAKQIMIITGRGLHSISGKSVLKEAIREYFVNMKIKCEKHENQENQRNPFDNHENRENI